MYVCVCIYIYIYTHTHQPHLPSYNNTTVTAGKPKAQYRFYAATVLLIQIDTEYNILAPKRHRT